MVVRFRPEHHPRTGGRVYPSRPESFEETFQSPAVGVNAGETGLRIPTRLVARAVVAGPARVAIAAAYETEPVPPLQGLPQDPLERSVRGCHLHRRLKGRLVPLEVGVFAPHVRRDQHVRVPVRPVHIEDVRQVRALLLGQQFHRVGVASQLLVRPSEVDVVVSAVPGVRRPLESRKRHEAARFVVSRFFALLHGPVFVVDQVVVALVAHEVQARDVACIPEEVADLVPGRDLAAVGVGPVQAPVGLFGSADNGVAAR